MRRVCEPPSRHIGVSRTNVCVPICAFALCLSVVLEAPTALAQRGRRARPPAQQTESTEEPAVPPAEEPGATEDAAGGSEDTHLRAPTLEPLDVPNFDAEPAEETPAEEPEAEAPSPPPAAPSAPAAPQRATSPDRSILPDIEDNQPSTAPHVSFTLHGYYRVRAELQNNFFLGRLPIANPLTNDERADLPFGRFRPLERGVTPIGGCGGSPDPVTGMYAPCGGKTLKYANMRLRLQPTLSLSDDVRVHMQVDALDNVVLGSTPETSVLLPSTSDRASPDDSSSIGLDSFATTILAPTPGRTSLQDSIHVRRAWAEVTNRALGQLRFGRMGSHWGLGMLQHGGDGIDSDFQTDIDRIMGMTKVAGFLIAAMYDFASEGFIQYNVYDPQALAYDAAQKDDVSQYAFSVVRRADEEDQQAKLERGEFVLNSGVYFLYRKQFLSSQSTRDPATTPDSMTSTFVRRDAWEVTPDLWVQFLWKKLRLELEAAWNVGGIERNVVGEARQNYKLLQFGFAFESEYRLLDDKLGITFYTGFATGDQDVDGLTARENLNNQHGDRRLSTFRFHPNYRIDLILWRNIMGQMAGAYYFRPGVSYDIIRDPFGQLLGARLDIIYSRASQEVQTWGSDPNLGVELDLSLYYRSEDGPSIIDGFHAMFQYGILFPLKGLGYPSDNGVGAFGSGSNPGLSRAQTLRLVLGVQI